VDAGSLFNAKGQGLNLRDGQGIWVSYADATYSTNKVGVNAFDPNLQQNQTAAFWGTANQKVNLDITLNGVRIQNANIQSIDDAIAYINTFTAPTDTRDGTGVKAVKNKDGSGIDFVNDNADGTTDNMKNINLVVANTNTAGELWNAVWDNNNQTFTFNNTGNGQAGTPTINKNGSSLWTATNITFAPQPPQAATNVQLTGGLNAQIITAHKYIYSSNPVDIGPMYNPDGGPAFQPGANATTRPTEPGSAAYWDAVNGGLLNTNVRTFRTTEDLRELLQRDARYGVDYDGSGTFAAADINQNIKVVVTADGHFAISNANEQSTVPPNAINGVGNATTTDPKNMSFNITAYSNKQGTVSTNDAFTAIFKAFDGPLVIGNQIKESEQLKLSAFSAGLEIYDSL
ncbi:flagellar hook protein FlgE, partial [Campylobacter jejuni]